MTPENNSDKLSIVQTGNRVVEEKPDKPVKVTKEKLDNSEKLNTFDEGKPKAKAEKASKLNKAEKDAETFAENSEKVTKTAEPIIQSTNKEQSRYEAAQEIVKKAEARQLSENEKAEIAAEYINIIWYLLKRGSLKASFFIVILRCKRFSDLRGWKFN